MGNNENNKWLRIIVAIIGVIIGIVLIYQGYKMVANDSAYNSGYKDSYKSTYRKK